MANTTVGRLSALLTADATQFTSVMDGAADKVSLAANNLVGVFVPAVSFGAIVSGIQQSIAAAEESYQVQQRLQAALDATGGAAGFTSKQLSDYAEALSRLSGIDDEIIKSGESLLISFGLQGEALTRATRLALDVSRRLGIDYSSAATTLGKALADPSEAAGRLARANIVLDATTRQNIKSLMEQGDAAGAASVIMDAVAKNFEGAAEKMRSSWAMARVEFGNLMEEIGSAGATGSKGGGFADIISSTLRWSRIMVIAQHQFRDFIGTSFKEMPEFFRKAAEEMATAVSAAMGIEMKVPEPELPEGIGKQLTAEQVAAISELESSLQKQIDTFGMSANAIKLWEAEQKNIPTDALESSRALMQQLDAMKALEAETKAWHAAEDASRKVITETIAAFEQESTTIGLTSDQLRIRKMQQQGATDAELLYARSIADSNSSTKQFLELFSKIESSGAAAMFDEMNSNIGQLQEALASGMISFEAFSNAVDKLHESFGKAVTSEAKRIHDATRTPIEKAQEEIANLNKLLELGEIPAEDYRRRLSQIGDELANVSDATKEMNQHPAAMEFGTAAAFSASIPQRQQDKGDEETHRLLEMIRKALEEAERNRQPINRVEF